MSNKHNRMVFSTTQDPIPKILWYGVGPLLTLWMLVVAVCTKKNARNYGRIRPLVLLQALLAFCEISLLT